MNKASGDDGIPVELFQILKDDAVKVLHSICQQFGKLSSGHRTGKSQFSFQAQRKAMPKNVLTTPQLHLPHTLAKSEVTLCDPMDVTYQAPPSMGFSRQEYWSGLPFPSPVDLPNPRIKPGSPALQGDSTL